MNKNKKPIPRINQLFAQLVKAKESQVVVANELGISSQSVGYYMRGRKIPLDVIEKWEARYGQNLMTLSRSNFENNIETIVSRETKVEETPKQMFDRAVENEAIKREMLDQLYKDLANQARHLDKALDLVARLLPPGKGVERVMTKD